MQTVRGTQVTGQKADRDGTTAVANNVKGKKKKGLQQNKSHPRGKQNKEQTSRTRGKPIKGGS